MVPGGRKTTKNPPPALEGEGRSGEETLAMLCPNPEALDDAYVNAETHRAMCEWIGVGLGHEKFKLKTEGPSMRVSFGDWWEGVRPWLGKKQWQTMKVFKLH